jgi:hypothetical protein
MSELREALYAFGNSPNGSGSIHHEVVDRVVVAALRVRDTASGGHRIDAPHDCFLMNCAGMAGEIDALRAQLSRVEG